MKVFASLSLQIIQSFSLFFMIFASIGANSQVLPDRTNLDHLPLCRSMVERGEIIGVHTNHVDRSEFNSGNEVKFLGFNRKSYAISKRNISIIVSDLPVIAPVRVCNRSGNIEFVLSSGGDSEVIPAASCVDIDSGKVSVSYACPNRLFASDNLCRSRPIRTEACKVKKGNCRCGDGSIDGLGSILASPFAQSPEYVAVPWSFPHDAVGAKIPIVLNNEKSRVYEVCGPRGADVISTNQSGAEKVYPIDDGCKIVTGLNIYVRQRVSEKNRFGTYRHYKL